MHIHAHVHTYTQFYGSADSGGPALMQLHTPYTHILQFLKLTYIHGREDYTDIRLYTLKTRQYNRHTIKIRAENNTNNISNKYIPFRQCAKANQQQARRQTVTWIYSYKLQRGDFNRCTAPIHGNGNHCVSVQADTNNFS